MAPDEPAPRRRRARRRRRHPVRTALATLVVALVVFLGATTGGLLAAPVDFTPPSPPRPVLITDRNGKLIGEIASSEQRVELTAAQIPDVMRNAVVAAEDKSFYSNSGIDPVAIVRATANDLRGGASQGGSTITQQYVKNVFVGDEHSISRKIKEAALAFRLDHRLSKQEILTRYLNVVYFGNRTYGVQAASRYYFGVDAKSLTLSQASLLAGIIPAPSDYNPVHSLTLARQRQMYVLNRMVDSGYIDAGTASTAYAAVPKIVGRSAASAISSAVAPQFVADVTSQITTRYASQPELVDKGGLGVRTTLDVNWQRSVNDAIAKVLPGADDPEAAVVVMDMRDGSILAEASRTTSADRQNNLARALTRQSGSSVKPFTLATALQNGYTLDSQVYGPSAKTYPVSQCGSDRGKPYTVTNDEGGGGTYSLSTALAKSVNTVYGPLAITLGTHKVAATAQAAGLLSPAQAAKDTFCSMGLGVETSPLQEATAYSTLANGGVHHDPHLLMSVNQNVGTTGAGGTTIYRQPVSKATQAIPADVAGQVQQAMRGVVSFGTATAAQQPDGLDVFGKTGTTNDFVDAWFSGCIPAYHVCMSTWMGYLKQANPDGSPHTLSNVEGVYHVVGGTLPAKIFAQTMDGFRAAAKPVIAPTSSSPAPPSTPLAPRRTFFRRSSTPPAVAPTRSSRRPAPTAPVSTSRRASPTPRPTPTPTPTGVLPVP